MLRLFLPPNLSAAAARDAIPVKLELDLTGAASPPAELLPGLALLSQWMGAGPKAGAAHRAFLQLTRRQVRELVKALVGQPVFSWANRPEVAIGWREFELEGVSELVKAEAKEGGPRPPGEGGLAGNVARPSPGGRGPPNRSAAGTPMTVDGSEHFIAVALPSKDHSSYTEVLALLKGQGFLPEPSNAKWWIRDRHRVLMFLASHGGRMRGEFGARFTANFEKNTARIKPAEIVCSATENGQEIDVTIGLRAGAADEAALHSALMGGRGYFEAGGEIVLLDPGRLRKLGEAQAALAGGGDTAVALRRSRRLSAAGAIGIEQVLEELSPGFQPPAAWQARSAALRHLSSLEPAPIAGPLAAQLRPYQRLGAAWLWHLHRNRLGGILADEMGLGKTLQALALLSARSGQGTSLVVCPASLLENWRREAARFTPGLRVFVHHGEQRLAGGAAAAGRDLIITSYGTLVRDETLFSEITFDCVVADEAQHIKNRRSQNARSLRSLKAAGRFVLTGTPVENSLDDLRSLVEFVLPGYVEAVPAGLRGEERSWFDRRLREQSAPFILRRTKAAVAPELPAKLEQVLWCELTPAQAALYRSFREKAERELDQLAGSGANDGQMRLAAFTQLLRLRQICCDPRLVGDPRSEVGPDRRAGRLDSAAVTARPAVGPYPDSAKLEAFRELVAEAIDDGHRLLVFSQFTSLLALLREDLAEQGLEHCYLDGSMTARSRQAEVDRFQESADIPVFLLSLKAGGTGLNLTGADTVVHFDPWWNPAAEMQATDRAHRIGQTRVVTSYKLIASGTVEEKVLGLQAAKRAMLADVFEASDAATASLSLTELKDLMR